jgi:hypothetical protein
VLRAVRAERERSTDGRTILVAGEHEDFYDPDFWIYNDVVVQHPGGALDLFGYPREVFPPTDFHSATVAGSGLILIGRLGYRDERRLGVTPVLRVDLDSFAVGEVATSGTPPGWIYKHTAALSVDGGAILVRGGNVVRAETSLTELESIDDWRLDLASWRWERLTERAWPRFEVFRRDRKQLHLYELESLGFERRYGLEDPARAERLRQDLGRDPDPRSLDELFRPAVAHEVVPEVEDESWVSRIRVGEVVVRYAWTYGRAIVLTIEGALPEATVDALTADLVRKLQVVENAACELQRLP